MKLTRRTALKTLLAVPVTGMFGAVSGKHFEGKHFRGRGDVEYLQLLDIARRMFHPDPQLQNLAMLYKPEWNGLVEGPTWEAWWIQNSYGPTYCALPFLQEPFLTFLQNSQDLWFNQMGDGQRHGCPRQPQLNWVAPDGQLCDGASPGCIIYKQGDGRTGIHDWGLEFTAAGVVMQAELLLISRDRQAIAHYLPKLERCADFLESRRDPKNNLFLAGPAANLLAPSYAGWRRPDGAYGKAYLAGLSITTLAALQRLIELEKLAGAEDKAALYAQRCGLIRKGLPLLTTGEGYFIKSLDPDGTRHGVWGAARHGYFEAVVNHDAICFRIADHAQAEKIYAKMAAIPGLRPYDFIITNYPSLDDMYEPPKGLWRFGEWVNGGAWSTCEARMIMAYYRLGKYEDARRSMRKLLTYARRYRLDNNFTDFGNAVYQPQQPINLTYDVFGIPAALIRGLFEYLYRADGLTLVPHIPAGITRLEQLDPIRFGNKQLYLSVAGRGPISAVTLNGRRWTSFNQRSVFLPYDRMPERVRLEISLGRGNSDRMAASGPAAGWGQYPAGKTPKSMPPACTALEARAAKLNDFYKRLADAGLGDSYEAAHTQLALDAVRALRERRDLLAAGKLQRLPEPVREAAADQSYQDAATRLMDGLEAIIQGYRQSRNKRREKIAKLYRLSQAG